VNLVINNYTDSKNTTFGIRDIKVIQDPLPNGKSFYFKVNGVNSNLIIN
jgi:hypothetical protein